MTAYDSEVGTPTKIGSWERAVDVLLLVLALTTIPLIVHLLNEAGLIAPCVCP